MSVRELRQAIQATVSGLDPALLDGPEAERLLQEFVTIKKSASAAVALLARRVAACGAATRAGARSDEEWLSNQTGERTGDARRSLAAAKDLESAAATDAAFRNGELSEEQAALIAPAAAKDPGTEQQLIAMAKRQPLDKLREECDRILARGEDAEEKHRRIHRQRSWRTWSDRDGARCGSYRLTPEAAARLEAAARPFVDAAFDAARREGRREAPEAYAADGLVAMADAARNGRAGTGPRRKADVHTTLLVNVESLRRGHVEGDEICEIPGVGPVPVATALDLLGPDGLKLAVRDGHDVKTVVLLGRSPSAAQRTAIHVRDRGRCIRPTCGRPAAEIDHTVAWSGRQLTLLDDLGSLCAHDHDLKTHAGHHYRHGPQGWEWHRPDGTVETERPPPAAA